MPDSRTNVAIALGVIFGCFFVAAVAIVYYFIRKHYRRNYHFQHRFFQMTSGDEDPDSLQDGSSYKDAFCGETELHTQATFLIPYGLSLLKSCKSLAHRLLESVVDGTSKDQPNLVTGDLDEIVAASRAISPCVDQFISSMNSPLDEKEMQSTGSALVSSIDQLVHITRANCAPQRLGWLEESAGEVFQNFRNLCLAIDRFRHAKEQLDYDA